MKDSRNWLILLLGGASLFLYFMFSRVSNKLIEVESLNMAQNDTLQLYKGKDSLNRARIGVLQTENAKTFLAFQTQDTILKQLQKAVEENRKYLKKQGSVTNISTGTDIDTSSPTEVVYVTKDSLPTYKSKFNLGGWIYGNSVANKDSTYLDLKVKNDFTLTIGEEPQGFLGLGKGKPFADIKLLNPYSEVKSLRTYRVTPNKRKNFSVGPSVNFGTDFTGKFYGTIGISIQPEKLTIKF